MSFSQLFQRPFFARSSHPVVDKAAKSAIEWYAKDHDKSFVLLLTFTTFMTIWPWVFFGIVVGLDGVAMPHRAAKIANDHPQDVSFFVTSISNTLSFVVGYLFTAAVSRLAQKYIVHKDPSIAHVSFFTNLKNRSFPMTLFNQGRLRPLLTVVLYMLVFNFVTSGISALLTPVIFNRHAQLQATELNFGATDPACVAWFNNNTISHQCDWTDYKGVSYTTCLEENQLVDVLDAARGNILSRLSNNTVSLTYTQLGAVNGLHLLGSTRGMLPIGPNGIPAFDTVLPSPFTKAAVDSFLPYNYSLDLQGITNNVSCSYATDSPVTIGLPFAPITYVYQFNGTCPTGQDFLGTTAWTTIASANTLGFWACETSTSGDAYNVYLRGIKNYNASIGNITCTVEPALPAVFKLDYAGSSGVFNSTQKAISTSPGTSTELVRRAIGSLGNIIWQAQSQEANALAESVFTFGVKSFNLPQYQPVEGYLRLYEAMIGGIIDYESTYIRLLYSTKIAGQNPAPESCLRTVGGTADYGVFGWVADGKTAAYLIPMTVANLTTLIILAIAMSIRNRGEGRLPHFDPTDPESLVYSSDQSGNLLRDITADQKARIPGKAKTRFGRGPGRTVRLWVNEASNIEPIDEKEEEDPEVAEKLNKSEKAETLESSKAPLPESSTSDPNRRSDLSHASESFGVPVLPKVSETKSDRSESPKVAENIQ